MQLPPLSPGSGAIPEISLRHRAALEYAKAGWPVFPCLPDAKRPACAHGFKDATTDIEQIDRWWAQADFNVAFSPASVGLCVVDLDRKNGVDGLNTWLELSGDSTFDTWLVETPSNGLHVYFQGRLPPSAGKLGAGIDIRSEGSYVLLPPSKVDGKPYRIEFQAPVKPLPAWVVKKLKKRELPPRKAAAEGLDWPASIDEACTWLRQQPGAIEGQGGNDHSYRVAAELRDLAISEETALDLLQEHWNPRCEPPWDDEELATIVSNAYHYAQNEPGSKSWPMNNPEEIERLSALQEAHGTPEPEASEWPAIYTATQLMGMQFEPPRFVWADRLLQAEPNLYTGDGGVGKTTLAENLAVAVAAGIPLLGHATSQMPVMLLVAEDGLGPVKGNLAAIRQALDAPEGCLDQIHILSVKSSRVTGGHRLATIADDGKVSVTSFFGAHLLPYLHSLGECLWVIDPLEEFVLFDRYKDAPPRALATNWLREVCELGVTPLVLDHPSKASMASGAHYAGSIQLKAAFSLFATLKADKWTGGTDRQRELTFEVLKGRYAGETETRMVRTADSPAFRLPTVVSPTDHMMAVYRHIAGRLQEQKNTWRNNRGEYGPREIAPVLGLTEKAITDAMSLMESRNWLRYDGRWLFDKNAPKLEVDDGF